MEDFEKGFELELDVIEIEQEDGTLQECVVQDEFEIDDKSYIVLSPIDEDNFVDETVVYFFRVEEDGDDMMLETIEDDEELYVVKAAYEDYLESDFDEEDEE